MEMDVELLKPGRNSLQDIKKSVTSNNIGLGARGMHWKDNLNHSSVLPEVYNKHMAQYQQNEQNLQVPYYKHTGEIYFFVTFIFQDIMQLVIVARSHPLEFIHQFFAWQIIAYWAKWNLY